MNWKKIILIRIDHLKTAMGTDPIKNMVDMWKNKKILCIHLKKSLKKYIIQSFILFGKADQ